MVEITLMVVLSGSHIELVVRVRSKDDEKWKTQTKEGKTEVTEKKLVGGKHNQIESSVPWGSVGRLV